MIEVSVQVVLGISFPSIAIADKPSHVEPWGEILFYQPLAADNVVSNGNLL